MTADPFIFHLQRRNAVAANHSWYDLPAKAVYCDDYEPCYPSHRLLDALVSSDIGGRYAHFNKR